MYTIHYNSNPKNPEKYNHLGSLRELTAQSSKSFTSLDEAIDFWFECHSPITSLLEFTKDMKNIYVELSEQEIIEILGACDERDGNREEQLLKSQTALYSLENRED